MYFATARRRTILLLQFSLICLVSASFIIVPHNYPMPPKPDNTTIDLLGESKFVEIYWSNSCRHLNVVL